MSFIAAWILFLAAVTGGFDEPLRSVLLPDAGVGPGDVPRLQGLERAPRHSIRVFGLHSDGINTPNTATPSPTPEPIVIVPVGTVTPVCEWECILRSVGWSEWDIPEAGRKIQCESGFNPYAYNPSGASGWFQVMMPLHAYRLRPGEDIFDVYVNSRVALEIFRERGWAAWVC